MNCVAYIVLCFSFSCFAPNSVYNGESQNMKEFANRCEKLEEKVQTCLHEIQNLKDCLKSRGDYFRSKPGPLIFILEPRQVPKQIPKKTEEAKEKTFPQGRYSASGGYIPTAQECLPQEMFKKIDLFHKKRFRDENEDPVLVVASDWLIEITEPEKLNNGPLKWVMNKEIRANLGFSSNPTMRHEIWERELSFEMASKLNELARNIKANSYIMGIQFLYEELRLNAKDQPQFVDIAIVDVLQYSGEHGIPE